MCLKLLNFNMFKTEFTILFPPYPAPPPACSFLSIPHLGKWHHTLILSCPSQTAGCHLSPSPSISLSYKVQSTWLLWFWTSPSTLDQTLVWSAYSWICPFKSPLHTTARMSFLSSNLIVASLGLKPFRASFRGKSVLHTNLPTFVDSFTFFLYEGAQLCCLSGVQVEVVGLHGLPVSHTNLHFQNRMKCHTTEHDVWLLGLCQVT